MRKQITQAELWDCLDLEKLVNRKMIQIRERIRKGASIEPGELGARIDAERIEMNPECNSYDNMGLDIDDAERIEKFLAWEREWDAKQMRSKLIVIRGGATVA